MLLFQQRMPKAKPVLTFKQEVDYYFTTKYKQLESTTTKIINKCDRNLEAGNVISAVYLYVLANEDKIIAFAIANNKTIQHSIYSFTKAQLNFSIFQSNSKINIENDKLYNKLEKKNKMSLYDFEEDDCTDSYVNYIDHYKHIEYEHNIYTEEFIQDFYMSLDKLDAICFEVYYFEGIEKAKDFAEHFDISLSSAYASINRLKTLLKQYILKYQITKC